VNPGGEPERDETGLPPVHIEIPDDARELDRDVQAYYREQRAARRQRRRRRVRGSLAKDGIVLPLLACCLILALITGTLLTVFTATSDQNLAGVSGHSTGRPTTGGAASGPAAAGAPSAGASQASPGTAAPSARRAGAAHAGVASTPAVLAGVLPQTSIVVNGQAPVQVQNLSRTMLVLLPAHCNCSTTVSWLIGIATGAHARTYLVYTASTKADVKRLSQQLDSQTRARASLALEPQNLLRSSILGSLPGHGLAAILVGVGGHVHDAAGFSPSDDPTKIIQALTH
jgi:hypothetical protein